jgi:hypothetical protein
MHKIHEIIHCLKVGEPVSLARFNDGEAEAIIKPGCTVARGDQKVSQGLSDALREAIQYEQKNYYVGLPCPHCATGKWYTKIKDLVRPDYEYLTQAVVTTNRNWKLFISKFPEVISGKNVVWVGNANQKLSHLKKKTGINVDRTILVPPKNAWEHYEVLLTEQFEPGSIVILACGPMARVLVRQWFERWPDCSFLDTGSAFDPFTRNIWHRCHLGQLPPCTGCN